MWPLTAPRVEALLKPVNLVVKLGRTTQTVLQKQL